MKHFIDKKEIDKALVLRHGKSVQQKLENSHVAIAGLGGLGSCISLALARSGVGHLHLIDFDKVDLTNLNRQQYFLEDIGRYKTEAMRDEIAKINPYLDIQIDTVKVTYDNYAALFSTADIVCEAFDKPEEKAMLVDAFFEHHLPYQKLIAASGMAGYGSSNAIITRRISPEFYLCGDGQSDIHSHGSLMAPRVGICAAHEANMILQLILGDEDVSYRKEEKQ